MRRKARKLIAAGMCFVLLSLCASCSFENKEMAMKMFKNRDKISYSTGYTELKGTKRNDTDAWRDGMFSGNGEQGFITSGAPYSDSMIFQNVHFVMPAGQTEAAEAFADLNETRQALVNGERIANGMTDGDAYAFHPGGALRISTEKLKAKKYIRYTDYETGEVGETYMDENGTWERKSFTSFADNAVITDIASVSGARTTLTLSFDDIASMAGFGSGSETEARVRRIADENGSYLAFLGHYPDQEGSALKNSGWLTLVYVTTEGGETETVELEKNEKTVQDVSEANRGVRVANAYAVRLISLSRRIDDLGDMDSFLSSEKFQCVRDAARDAQDIIKKYQTDGFFDYDKALKAHTDIYTPQFNAVSLTLGEASSLNSNNALLSAQKGGKALDPAFVQRAYYAGRYVSLCCGGALRAAGLWTGEFNPGWGGVYDLETGAALFTAALNTGNMADAPLAYARFLLEQAPVWEQNAKDTHGFQNAIQAPLYEEGDVGSGLTAANSAASRWWNAGAAMLLRPLYEAVKTDPALELALAEDYDLEPLRALLSATGEPLSDEACEEILERGTLRLREDVLLPLLMRAANYWLQLTSPAYYTDGDGAVHYEAGKTSLSADETYCLIPGYAPGAFADASHAQLSSERVTANAAVDIAACSDTLGMLLDIAEDAGLIDGRTEETAETESGDETGTEEEDEDTDETAFLCDLSACEKLLARLPAYRNDDSGALEPWAAANDDAAGTLKSELSCVWPLAAAKENPALKNACAATLNGAAAETDSAAALLRRGLIAARLQDRAAVTGALLAAGGYKTRSVSFLAGERTDGKGAVSAACTAGFAALVNEALVQSDADTLTLLSAAPESGFEVGNVSGLRTACGVTVSLMAWELKANFVIADLTSDRNQTITVTSPLSSETMTVELAAGVTQTVSLSLDQTDAAPAPVTEAPQTAGEGEAENESDAETEAAETPAEGNPYDAELYDYGAED